MAFAPVVRRPAFRVFRFTLIELLVVIAIIAVLAGMLLPALGNVKEIGQASLCRGNLKNNAIALLLYAANADDWGPSGWSNKFPYALSLTSSRLFGYLIPASFAKPADGKVVRPAALKHLVCPSYSARSNWEVSSTDTAFTGSYLYCFGTGTKTIRSFFGWDKPNNGVIMSFGATGETNALPNLSFCGKKNVSYTSSDAVYRGSFLPSAQQPILSDFGSLRDNVTAVPRLNVPGGGNYIHRYKRNTGYADGHVNSVKISAQPKNFSFYDLILIYN